MINIALFGLTGMGNKVLEALALADCDVKYVVSRYETGEFPYYKTRDLFSDSKYFGIETTGTMINANVEDILKSCSIDLIIVSTFDKKIPRGILDIPRLGVVNLHPSLLPLYRGATPVYWQFKNKEKESGVTAHYMTEEIDKGDIILQEKISIEHINSEYALRWTLDTLAGTVALKLVGMFNQGRPRGVPQDEKLATYYPKYKREFNK